MTRRLPSLFLLFHGQVDEADAILPPHLGLQSRILVLRFPARAMGERDRRDDRHQQHDRGHLEWVDVVDVNELAERPRVAALGRRRRRSG